MPSLTALLLTSLLGAADVSPITTLKIGDSRPKLAFADLHRPEATPTWKELEGKFVVFDDSFDHEVWHEREGDRVVLIVDLWHPDLDEAARRRLSPI